MSIATQITRLQTNISDSFTAANSKGALMPAVLNSNNLSTCIDSINGGKYGAGIDGVLGDVDVNGVLQPAINPTNLVFTGVKNVADYVLQYKFQKGTAVRTVSFPDLETLSGYYAMGNMCEGCTNITSFSMPKLTVVSGNYACTGITHGIHNLTTIDVHSVTTISGNSAFSSAFRYSQVETYGWDSLVTISGGDAFYSSMGYNDVIEEQIFPELTTATGDRCFGYAFQMCSKLRKISFPKLENFGTRKTQFNNMLANCDACEEIHFKTGTESIISTLTGYDVNFGATNSTIYFDL